MSRIRITNHKFKLFISIDIISIIELNALLGILDIFIDYIHELEYVGFMSLHRIQILLIIERTFYVVPLF
jgi:hypothetical protein